MTIASEITALNTNLTAAKDAVTAKGGTVGDTGLAGLAAEIASIPAGGGGDEPGGDAVITGYDSTTGVISGYGFGSTAGTVYLLDRATHTYVQQPHSAWSPTSITLTTPIDLSVIEGTTSLVAVLSNGEWSTKQLITGQIAVTGFAKAYVNNPGTDTVRTIAVSSSEWSQFNPSNNAYSIQITCGGDTFYSDEVVGIQFGSDFNLTTLGYQTLAYFVDLNQPLVIPEGVTTIQGSFLNYCYNFNQPLVLPSTLRTMNGGNFMYHCEDFNQPMTIPYGVTDLGSYFMNYCESFNQSLSLPTTLTGIAPSFMSYSHSFDQPLVIPEGVTEIKNSFMNFAYSFNEKITFPSTLTTIGNDFLKEGLAFNNPLNLPASLTTIGKNFLAKAHSFDQPLTFSSGLLTIGDSFLVENYAFNQPVTLPSTLTTIGSYFLAYCYSLDHRLIVPSSVTSIGDGFLRDGYALSRVTVNTSASPIDNNSLAVGRNTCKAYVKGVTIDGTGASTWTTNLPNRTSSPYRNLVSA